MSGKQRDIERVKWMDINDMSSGIDCHVTSLNYWFSNTITFKKGYFVNDTLNLLWDQTGGFVQIPIGMQSSYERHDILIINLETREGPASSRLGRKKPEEITGHPCPRFDDNKEISRTSRIT